MENDTKTPYRTRKRGKLRVTVGTRISFELRDALEAEAAEQGVSLSTYAADVLAEKMGVPA